MSKQQRTWVCRLTEELWAEQKCPFWRAACRKVGWNRWESRRPPVDSSSGCLPAYRCKEACCNRKFPGLRRRSRSTLSHQWSAIWLWRPIHHNITLIETNNVQMSIIVTRRFRIRFRIQPETYPHHNFAVFLLVNKLVMEHVGRPQYSQFASRKLKQERLKKWENGSLGLGGTHRGGIKTENWTVDRNASGSCGQDGSWWFGHIQRRTVRVDILQSSVSNKPRLDANYIQLNRHG